MIIPLEIGLAVAFVVMTIATLLLAVRVNAERRRAREAVVALQQAKAVAAGELKARHDMAAEIKASVALMEDQRRRIADAATDLGRAVVASGQRFTQLDQEIAGVQALTRRLNTPAEQIMFASAQLAAALEGLDASPATRVASSRSAAPAGAAHPRRYPSVAPPGSATALSPAPAQIAAGLGPRPTSRPLAASETPHPPPVRVGAASRSAALPGVTSAPSVGPPPDSGDSGEWIHDERPSDADGERTRVGRRPSPDDLGVQRPARAAAPTLPSMKAIAADSGEGGGA